MLSQSHLSLHTNVQQFYLPLRIFPHKLTSCSTVKVHFLLSVFFFLLMVHLPVAHPLPRFMTWSAKWKAATTKAVQYKSSWTIYTGVRERINRKRSKRGKGTFCCSTTVSIQKIFNVVYSCVPKNPLNIQRVTHISTCMYKHSYTRL